MVYALLCVERNPVQREKSQEAIKTFQSKSLLSELKQLAPTLVSRPAMKHDSRPIVVYMVIALSSETSQCNQCVACCKEGGCKFLYNIC